MASVTDAPGEGGMMKNILLIVGLIAVLALAGWTSYQFVPRSGGITGVSTPNPSFDFLTAKAKECQGDFSKLSPEDQAKVNAASNNRGAEYMARAWAGISKSQSKQ